jgi:hypothetical protein
MYGRTLMATVDNLFYEDIAKELESKNKPKPHQYFYAQKYLPPDNTHPFGSILPLTDEFFGPRNLTLLILSKPYQFEPTLLQQAKDRIKKNYEKWSKYRVMIWVDMVLALKMADAGDDDYYSDMQDFANNVEQFCTEMKPYGITYMGLLLDGKDAAFFQQFIDEFYADKSS